MPPRKKRPAAESVGIAAQEVAAESPPETVKSLADRIHRAGGTALASYREPLGANWVVFAALPVRAVTATPFQRELSKTHVERLSVVIPKVGRFLDPIVAVPGDDVFWTPNGMHRLEAMRKLGAKAVMALVVPEREVAYRILALNTEKAHNLKDKSLEVVRMARAMADQRGTARSTESDWAFEFEEPAYLTIGICYEERPRFSGGAYLPILRRCETFSNESLSRSLVHRAERAARVLELDEEVNRLVAELKRAGLKSAYLKPFVVARLNPLRFVRAAKPGQKAAAADFGTTLDKMFASARKFDASKVRPQDVASMGGGGAPPEE